MKYNVVNYQRELDKILKEIEKSGYKPKLLLHSCCAPCSSYTVEYLKKYFDLTVFYYNPNIYPDGEYIKRLEEQKRLLKIMDIPVIEGEYDRSVFYDAVKGHEGDGEGGARCAICERIRLAKTAELAKEQNFDYFCTTLSISPLKNAPVINEIGISLEEKYGVKFLPSDFKKKGGYLRSIELSREYGLYRQNYCGCEFSMNKNPIQPQKT